MGGLTPIPAIVERVLITSDLSFDGFENIAVASQMDRMRGRAGSTVLLTGQLNAATTGHPRDPERWRIVNTSPMEYPFRLHVGPLDENGVRKIHTLGAVRGWQAR